MSNIEETKKNIEYWENEMKADKMCLNEAIDIVDRMYQDKYRKIEENGTIYIDKLDDVKFTILEFASVRLLREVQSLQSKLEKSIPKQKVKDKIKELKNDIKNNNCRYPYILEHKIDVLQELLEEEGNTNENITIHKEKVKEVLRNNRNELFTMTYLSKEQYRPYEMQVERINKIEQELLEGEENGNDE